MSENNAEAKANEILLSLKKGKTVYDTFATDFKTRYLIGGSNIVDWEKKFKIKVPATASPAECKNLDIKLMELHSEAIFHAAASKAVLQALKRGIDTEMNSRKTALVAEYNNTKQKLPAAATLESMVRAQVDDIDGAMMAAVIASSFWQDVLDHLAFCRKLIENISINNGIEAKLR